MRKNLMIVAGEVSGDMHAARIVAALRKKDADLECWGIGGDELRENGVEILYDVKDMAVMGISEVLRRYGFFKRVFRDMLTLAEERKPDAVLLVDYPGFNIRIAEKLHEMGIKVLYYVCPQVWAWHRSRIPKMARIIDRMMVIFPFEVDVFAGTDLQVDFVGHPLVEVAERVRAEPLVDLPWGEGTRLALLPGSRRHEVQRILPVMLDAAQELQRRGVELACVIAAPSERIETVIQECIQKHGGCDDVKTVVGETRQVLRQAKAAMVASGTATIETALQECPMIIVYKTAWLTYRLARLLVTGVKHIGMVNIVAGRMICPEFIQQHTNAKEMANVVSDLLVEGTCREQMLNDLQQMKKALGREDGISVAADIVLSEL